MEKDEGYRISLVSRLQNPVGITKKKKRGEKNKQKKKPDRKEEDRHISTYIMSIPDIHRSKYKLQS